MESRQDSLACFSLEILRKLSKEHWLYDTERGSDLNIRINFLSRRENSALGLQRPLLYKEIFAFCFEEYVKHTEILYKENAWSCK